MDLFEEVTGARFHYNTHTIGGNRHDITPGWAQSVKSALAVIESRIPEYESITLSNGIFFERTKGIGILDGELALELGITGPILRASGVDHDLRRDAPYHAYDEIEVKVASAEGGDGWARSVVRLAELRESLRRCQEQLSQWTGQPVQLFRPSHGVRTRALLAALRDTGLRLCLWDHGVWDTDAPSPQTLLWRMRAVWSLGEKAGRPRVLLLHDGRGDELGPPPHTDSLLLALAELLPELARHIPSRSQQLPLRAMDAPDLAEVGHDVAQIRDLRVTR